MGLDNIDASFPDPTGLWPEMLLGGAGGPSASADFMNMSLDARHEISGLSGLERQLLTSTEANQLLDDLAFLYLSVRVHMA